MRLSLLGLLFVFASPVKADDLQDYYPMKVGMVWTYKLVGIEDRFVATVTKEEKVGDQNCSVIEGKLKGNVIAKEHVAMLNDGLFRFKFSDQNVQNNIEPAICFIKGGIKKGDTWKQDYKFGDTKMSVTYTMDVEDVEVPAGKYKDTILIRASAIDKADEKETVTKTTIWYAKGVGMVKQVILLGDQRITLDLEKFEEPKK
ncbi:MAG: hypothetical protein K8T89_23125 [Planctomycetes bacterium]|nr:hypothetical protein [Planctomycetota bacterium]